MIRLLIYLFLFGLILYFLAYSAQKRNETAATSAPGRKPRRGLRSKKDPFENWVQVYETASMDEARGLQARLQEEEIECVLYEQGKKDIYGNAPAGIGIAVPKSAMAYAQEIIARTTS